MSHQTHTQMFICLCYMKQKKTKLQFGCKIIMYTHSPSNQKKRKLIYTPIHSSITKLERFQRMTHHYKILNLFLSRTHTHKLIIQSINQSIYLFNMHNTSIGTSAYNDLNCMHFFLFHYGPTYLSL